MLRAYQGAKLSAEQAKQALADQLVNQARLEIFGTFPITHNGRMGRKEIRGNLLGPAITKYYSIRNRAHKAAPKLQINSGLVELVESMQFHKKDAQANEAVENEEDDDKEEEVEKAKVKLSDQVTEYDRMRARFNSLIQDELAKLRLKGDMETNEDNEKLILKIVQENFITPEDKKLSAEEEQNLQAEEAKEIQSKRILERSEEDTVMESARAVQNGAELDAEGNPIKTESAEGGVLEATQGTIKAKLPTKLLFEHTIERAMQRLRAKLQQRSSSSSSGQNPTTDTAHPLANVLQKLSISPDNNLTHLLYGPTFQLTADSENYKLNPYSRPRTPSQLADEVRATERRQRLLAKTLNLAPQELPAFRTYCLDTSRALYADGSAQQKRFAAALQRLSDPETCMQLGEAELAAEAAEDRVVRLVAISDSSSSSDNGQVRFVPDTAPAAEQARAVESSQRQQRALQAKLLTRAEADSDLARAAKARDAADRALLRSLEKFRSQGPQGLDAVEKTAVLRSLIAQLDDEEAMYEAVEMQELSARELTPVTMMDLQYIHQNLNGVVELDFTERQATTKELLAWTKLVLSAPSELVQQLGAKIQGLFELSCQIRDINLELEQLGSEDVEQVHTLEQRREQLESELRVGMDAVRALAISELKVAEADAFEFTAQLVNLWNVNGVRDLRVSLEFTHIAALRAQAELPALPITARHFEQASASASSASASSSTSAALPTASDARLLAAMRLWLQDRAAGSTVVYQPFLPARRRLIALRHEVATAANDDARLALFFARAQVHQAEVEQALKVRLQEMDVIREHAALTYLQRAWRPTGGYVAPEDDDWEEQVERLKEMNKYKTSKKGEGKRGKKK